MIVRARRLLLLAMLAPLLARAWEAQPASPAPPAPATAEPASVEPATVEPGERPVPAEPRRAGPEPAGPDGPPPAGPTDEEDDPSLYEGWATPQEPEPPRPEPITLLFSLGAYYTSAGLYLPLTRTPTPDAGEQSEARLYWRLLQRALVPRFVVLEASVNPMPCAGLLARRWDEGYRRAQLTGELNAVRALTAGFDEPFAVSLFVGNVADYDVRGRRDVRGRGYLGVVVSGGAGHIKDNALYQDRWLEAEVKLKGDRTTDAARLSWSFRAGVKLHDNPWIADTAYLGLRRSRVDFEEGDALLANVGAEYRFDASLAGKPLRHFLLVDRKWPLGRWKAALVLGVGVLWEAGAAYRGPLAGREGEAVQLLVRPNLVL